jgi:hypothetical protein
MQTSATGRPKGPDLKRPSMHGSAPGSELASLDKRDRLLLARCFRFRRGNSPICCWRLSGLIDSVQETAAHDPRRLSREG